MRFKRLLLFCLLAAPVSTGWSQITITESNVATVFGSRTAVTSYVATSFDGLQALAEQTGGNQTFDLRSATFEQDDAFSFDALIVTCAETLPGCQDPALNTANLITQESYGGTASDSVALSFFDLTNVGLFFRGGATRGDFDETNPGLEEASFTFTPAMQLMQLPLTMGTAWSFDTELSSSDLPGVVFEMAERYVVDAWGTLITPGGQMEALKLRNETISGFEVAPGVILVDTSTTIQFLTKGLLGATIELDSEGAVVGAGYTLNTDTGQSVDPGSEQPRQATLAQNYPNPFNPSTTIAFDLSQTGPVRLAVYDLLGREVAVLIDGLRPSGVHAATFEAGALPSGVYLYKLETAAETQIRQMVLLK
ncbi:MAG: T9SS type A sorting domain-containing protein [Bacteroidetes bacterium]|jgi:hypothetical protein|nr:T9SS type A sorting domain-containing protein [Bacteroidota bacterium]